MANHDSYGNVALHVQESPAARPQIMESDVDLAPAPHNMRQVDSQPRMEGSMPYHPPLASAGARTAAPLQDAGVFRRPAQPSLLRVLASLASSGVVDRFDYDILDMEEEAQEGSSPDHVINVLEELVPGLTQGEIKVRILQAGEGTTAMVAESIPGEAGTFSTTVDGRGCVIGANIEKVTRAGLRAGRCTFTIPGTVRDAIVEFEQDGGATEILSRSMVDGREEEAKVEDEKWMQMVSSSYNRATDQVAAAFMFEPALPLGTIVTKIRRGRVLVLGDYYGWEVS
eukprot:765579-Hanusia_phi.AAC.1